VAVTFWSSYKAFLVRPRETAAAVAADGRRLTLGLAAFLVPVVGYLVVYAGLGHSGAYPSRFSPWLAIPADEYYRWNLWLLAPSMFAAWLLASAVVQLASRPLGGTGQFEGTLAVLGFACSAAHWTLLPHDVLVGVLGGLHVIDGRAHEHAMNQPTLARALLWTFLALYLIAFPWFFSRALAGAHRLRGARAAVLGVLGFVVYQLVFVVFNR
jgi:hypothetical protein